MEDSKGPAPAAATGDPAPRTIGAFLIFALKKIIRQRKLLLLPLWVILAVVGILLLLSGGSSLLPVIYIAF